MIEKKGVVQARFERRAGKEAARDREKGGNACRIRVDFGAAIKSGSATEEWETWRGFHLGCSREVRESAMTQGEDETGAAKKVGIEKRFELAEGYVKTVLSLSTGALVLSVTFLHEIIGIGSEKAPTKIEWKGILVGAWVGFYSRCRLNFSLIRVKILFRAIPKKL